MQASEEAPDPGESAAVSRLLLVGEESWIVREAGSTRSGTGSDAGAPLMLLTFAREEEPGVPIREVMAVGSSLENLSDLALEELFERSRAFRKPPGRSR